ncbi:MAG: hypothetical protein ACRESZ_17570 [Methylococcales bacterium]
MSDTTNNKKAVFECPALKVVALLAVPSLVFLVIIIYILCKASVDNNGFPVLYFTVMLGSFAMLWLLIRSVNGLLGQCISACERVKLEQCRNDGQKNMLNEQNRSKEALNALENARPKPTQAELAHSARIELLLKWLETQKDNTPLQEKAFEVFSAEFKQYLQDLTEKAK